MSSEQCSPNYTRLQLAQSFISIDLQIEYAYCADTDWTRKAGLEGGDVP